MTNPKMAAMDNARRRIGRIVYRNVLRASDHGKHPHVLGEYGSQLLLDAADAKSNPLLASSQLEIKRIMKQTFRSGGAALSLDKMEDLGIGNIHNDSNNDSNDNDNSNDSNSNNNAIDELLNVMRHVNARKSIWQPDQLPNILPIFDFSHSAMLMGESTEFVFFEPRYRKLVLLSMLTAASSTDNQTYTASSGGASSNAPNGYFLLRSRPFLPDAMHDDEDTTTPNSRSITTLAQIVRHTDVSGDQILAKCMGGPRMQVLEETELDVWDDKENEIAPSLAVATRFTFEHDISFDDDDQQLRAECLELLQQATPLSNIADLGMFPPLELEAFSFWILQLVMGRSDIGMRHKWLGVRSTQRRLEFVRASLAEFVAQKERP